MARFIIYNRGIPLAIQEVKNLQTLSCKQLLLTFQVTLSSAEPLHVFVDHVRPM